MQEPSPSNSTRLCDIVVVLIRLLAIKVGLDAINLLLGARYPGDAILQILIPFCVLGACAYWLWQLAPFFSRRITRGRDSALDCGNLTLSDLYAFAFLLVGLYFVVDTFGSALIWFHYAMIKSAAATESGLSDEQKTHFYTLFRYLAKLLLGFAFIFNGRNFATKLIRKQNAKAAVVDRTIEQPAQS